MARRRFTLQVGRWTQKPAKKPEISASRPEVSTIFVGGSGARGPPQRGLLLVVVCCLCLGGWGGVGGGPGARGPQVLAGREATGLVQLKNDKDSDSKISHTRTARAVHHEGGVRDKQTKTRANPTDKHKHQAHDRQPFNQTQSNNLSRNKQRKTPLTSKQFNNPYTRLQNKQAKKQKTYYHS